MCVPQLLIGFESGIIVMWDLRAKRADFRIYYDEVSVKCLSLTLPYKGEMDFFALSYLYMIIYTVLFNSLVRVIFLFVYYIFWG